MGIRQPPSGIKDANLRGFLQELRNAVNGVSDQVTKIIATRPTTGGGGGGTDPGTNPPDPSKPPVGDGYPPPAPTSLQAIPAAFSVTLVWTNPVIADLQATEVWGRRSFDAWVEKDASGKAYEYLANAKVLVNGVVYRSRRSQDVNKDTGAVTLNSGFFPPTSPYWWQATTLAPTDRSKIGESAGSSWIHDGLTPGETWAYWVRNRDIENLFSTYFPADDIGVITTTLLDPGAYLDLLTNSITATQLYSDLGKRINLIDGPPELTNSVNARTTKVYNDLDGVIDKIVDGTTDITVQTPTGFTTLRALKTSTETSSAAIAAINDVSATSTSASAQSLSGMVAKVDNPTTGLAAAQGYIAQLNKIDVTSTSANVQELLGLRGQVNDKVTGLPAAVANINAINEIKVTSTSAAAQKIATLDATINDGSTSLTAQIAELNNVSADSTSANASKLAQVFASNATKVSVFFQATKPPTTNRVVGDLWYDTANSNKAYIWDAAVTGSDKWKVYRTAATTYTGNASGTAPTLGSTTSAPLYAGDLYIDTSTETVNGQSVPRNKTWRWSGTAWVDISNGTYSEAKASALVTNLEQSKIGYCTINSLATDHTNKTDCQNAGGTWHVGLPMATAVKQVSVQVPGVCYRNGAISGEVTQGACELEVNGAKGVWMAAGSAALEQRFIAQQEVNGRLYSQYTLKLDTNGWVSGFGLANTQQSDGTVVSDFGVRADRFWIATPTAPGRLEDLGAGLNELGETRLVVRTGQFRLAVNAEYAWYAYVQVADTADLAVNQFMTLKYIRATNTTTSANLHEQYNGSFLISSIGQRTVYGLNNVAVDLYQFGATVASRIVIFRTDSNLGQGFATSQSTGEFNDPPRLVSSKRLPFIVTTTTRTYNGVSINPGVYMNAAFIVDASITNAKIYGDIRSIDYNGEEAGGSGYGDAGWCINKLGNAIFNTVIVRSGANVGANALSWAYFYTQLTDNNSSRSNTFGPFTANTQHIMCWTPYFGSALSGSKALNIPRAPDRTTTIVCSLTFESPTKALATSPNFAIRQGANDGVWLELVSNNSVVQWITLFDAGGRDILARFFSSQGAFELTYAQANALSSAHVRVKIRQSNAISSESYYDNVRLFVQAFVS